MSARKGVDAEFEKLLGEIFGVDFIELFKAKRPAGWVDLMIAFESRKRAANPHKTSALNVSLPFSFIDFHKKHMVRLAFQQCVFRIDLLFSFSFMYFFVQFLKSDKASSASLLNTLPGGTLCLPMCKLD